MTSVCDGPGSSPALAPGEAARLLAEATRGLGGAERALLAEVADPRCPFCITLAALPWPPEGAELRPCPPHLALQRQLQCRAFNADPAHQRLAGRARAAGLTREHQRRAGEASWLAFSARWRAEQGLAPLTAEAARRYVTPGQIRDPGAGGPLDPELQRRIHRAWCSGHLYGAPWWRLHPDWAAELEARLEREARHGLAQPLLQMQAVMAAQGGWPGDEARNEAEEEGRGGHGGAGLVG